MPLRWGLPGVLLCVRHSVLQTGPVHAALEGCPFAGRYGEQEGKKTCSAGRREMAQQGVRAVLPHGRVTLAPLLVLVAGRCTVGGGPQRREEAPGSGSWGEQWRFLGQVDCTVPRVEWGNVEALETRS